MPISMGLDASSESQGSYWLPSYLSGMGLVLWTNPLAYQHSWWTLRCRSRVPLWLRHNGPQCQAALAEMTAMGLLVCSLSME